MNQFKQPLYLGLIGVFCFAPCMFSQASMQLTSAGSNVLGGVYVGPYYGTVNGQTNVPIICDDFTDESYIGETWSANVTTVSSNASTMLSQRLGLNSSTQMKDYGEAAYLAQQLMAGATCPPGTPSCGSANYAGDIQFAIWQIFDPSGSGDPFSYLSGNDYTNATNWLNYAAANAPSYSTDGNIVVYSPVGGGPPQEFLGVAMPETNSPIYWAIDLLGLAGLVFYANRRSKSSAIQA